MKSYLLSAFVSLISVLTFAGTTAEYIRANAVSMNDSSVPSLAISELSASRLLLIGDLHGTNEIPQVVYSVAKAFSLNEKILVGLEFPKDTEQLVSTFMKAGDENILRQSEFFTDPSYHSGKGSLQMIRLLKDLRDLKNVEVFCFDVPGNFSGTAEQRETAMALNILNSIRQAGGTKALIYTGNIHSRLTKGVPWNPNYVTMGSEIIRLAKTEDNLSSISSILVRPGAGSAFTCEMVGGKIECSPHALRPPPSVYYSTITTNYFLKEPSLTDGHTYSIVLQAVSASMPF